LIKDIVLRRETNQNRLNFCNFYNVILEKMGEVISMATIIKDLWSKGCRDSFLATKEQYRRQRMCHLLMNELEK